MTYITHNRAIKQTNTVSKVNQSKQMKEIQQTHKLNKVKNTCK